MADERRLPSGELAALEPFLFTTGLLVGVTSDAGGWRQYRTRYCYEHTSDARRALMGWDGTGDPPGPWVKQKPEERINPRFEELDNL